jgi:hypothetical protein
MTASLPLARLLSLEDVDLGEGEFTAERLKIGDMCYLAEIDGDIYLSFNAFHNGTNWMRVDITAPAYKLQFNIANNMVFESYKACTFWIASAAANPIGAIATVGGWELAYSMSQFRDWTQGGGGTEFDGHGTVEPLGYGRYQHATVSGVSKTGMLCNQFLDESGRDRPLKPSWQCGFQSDGTTDRFVLSRAAGGVSWPGWTELLTVSSAGVLAHVGNATIGGTLGVTGAITSASSTVVTKANRRTDAAFLALTDAATVAISMASSWNFKVTLGGDRTLGTPTGLHEGQEGTIQVIQDGTGSRTLAYSAAWSFGDAGAPTLSTAAGKIDLIHYVVLDATTPVIRAQFDKAA